MSLLVHYMQAMKSEIQHPHTILGNLFCFVLLSDLFQILVSIHCIRLLQLLCFVTRCYCVILIELW